MRCLPVKWPSLLLETPVLGGGVERAERRVALAVRWPINVGWTSLAFRGRAPGRGERRVTVSGLAWSSLLSERGRGRAMHSCASM